jgi:lysophospholipase L1-like esterase
MTNISLQKVSLTLTGLAIAIVVIEAGFRLIDPYPYYPPWEINHTEHGNLSEFDPVLGWKGVSRGSALFVTRNNKVKLEHNRFGFRDIDPERRSLEKSAIVFLGDSFTWGYEVNFNELFVNRIRKRNDRFEVFNLAHRGYGTDQSLMTFRRWHDSRELKLVFLMFSERDHYENNSHFQYGKHKPKFEVVENKLVLRNQDLLRSEDWRKTLQPHNNGSISLMDRFKYILFRSHFLHDISFRIYLMTKNPHINEEIKKPQEWELTKRIIHVLRDEVIQREGKLTIIAIPSKREFVVRHYVPYQKRLQAICEELGIDYLDLAPYFKSAFFRTYFRAGMHWNAYGHKIAADAIHDYLESNGDL